MVEVPDDLWKEIKEVLTSRQFVDLGDGDSDNDYEVLEVLGKIEDLEKEKRNG